MKNDLKSEHINSLAKFKNLITDIDNQLKIIIFSDSDSGSANIMKNTIKRLASESDFEFSYFFFDPKKHESFAKLLGVQKTPITFFIKNGEMLEHMLGNLSIDNVQRTINNLNSQGSR